MSEKSAMAEALDRLFASEAQRTAPAPAGSSVTPSRFYKSLEKFGAILLDAFSKQQAQIRELKARIGELESGAGIQPKAALHVVRSVEGPPVPGEVRRYGGMAFKCTAIDADGRPRWRCVP